MVLSELLPNADEYEEVMVFIRAKNGITGMVTNLETFDERIALLETIKAQMTLEEFTQPKLNGAS